MKRLARALFALALLLAAIWFLVPPEGIGPTLPFDQATIGPDPDAYLATAEAKVPGLTPGTEKRIVWAGAPGARTPLAVIYLHGFSATSEEIRPVPDQVAKALGANLFYTRLTGHGLTGEALAAATAAEWLRDLDEALAIGRRIGARTLLIGTSTGGTLATLAAANPTQAGQLAGLVLISPNFRLQPASAIILDLPGARLWGPWIAGATRSFAAQSDAHARYWTTRYPTLALFPMAALVRAARAINFGAVQTPALFLYSPQDQVVSHRETERVAAAWGGPAARIARIMGPKDDPFSHVIAGDILSPGQTAQTTSLIIEWAQDLPQKP